MYRALQRLVIVTIVSILFYITGSYVFDELYSKNVFVSGTWTNPPQIVICKESRIPIANILNAIDKQLNKDLKVDDFKCD